MNKRRHFILVTLIVSVCQYLVQLAPFDWIYQSILALVLFSFCYLLLLFFHLSRDLVKSLRAAILPVCFLAGTSLFQFLFSQGLVWNIVLSLILVFGFYTICLIENVFLVSAKFKVVPLYRAAATVSFLLTLTSAFFLFDVLFSFRLSALMNSLGVFVVATLLSVHLFWSVDLSSTLTSSRLPIILALSLIMGEMSLALSFWPVGVGMRSLYLVSLFYVFGGLAQAQRRQRLFRKTALEFVWVGAGIFLALLLVTSWSGNF